MLICTTRLFAFQNQKSELRDARAKARALKGAAADAEAAIAARGSVIAGLLAEQHEDRTRVQRLLALSQPVTPDLTVLFEHFVSADQLQQAHLRRAAAANSSSSKQARKPLLRTRRYEQHLLKKIETLQAHAAAVDVQGRLYLEALGADASQRSTEAADAAQAGAAAAEPLQASVAAAEARLKEVTGDYLALRRAARSAHAVSRQQHADCRAVQEALKQQRREAKQKVVSASQQLAMGAQAELEFHVAELRSVTRCQFRCRLDYLKCMAFAEKNTCYYSFLPDLSYNALTLAQTREPFSRVLRCDTVLPDVLS